MDIIIQFLAYLFVELIFGKIIKGIVRLVYLMGVVVLKGLTLSSTPIAQLKTKYQESSLPYFIGFGLLIGLIYWISTM